jgi:hypothetical protein
VADHDRLCQRKFGAQPCEVVRKGVLDTTHIVYYLSFIAFGLFLTLFLLFIRFMPAMAISELKNVLPAADPHGEGAMKPHAHARGGH